MTDADYLRDLALSYGAIEYPDMDMDGARVRRIADDLEGKEATISQLGETAATLLGTVTALKEGEDAQIARGMRIAEKWGYNFTYLHTSEQWSAYVPFADVEGYAGRIGAPTLYAKTRCGLAIVLANVDLSRVSRQPGESGG